MNARRGRGVAVPRSGLAIHYSLFAIRPVLIVMARAPRVGAGKQRLAASIGRVEAWRINRGLQAHTLRVARDRRWSAVLCVTPDNAVSLALPDIWPRNVVRIAQGRGDLGERLARVLRALGRTQSPVAIVGTDCPGLARAHIAATFRALQRKTFAIGPCPDGGFWIIAARCGRAAARAMAGVRWSTPHAFEDVVARLPERPAVMATLRDVDTIEDWRIANSE